MFSLPKMIHWLPVAQETIAENSLMMSMAIWQPEELGKRMQRASGPTGAPQVRAPRSQEEFEAMLKANGG